MLMVPLPLIYGGIWAVEVVPKDRLHCLTLSFRTCCSVVVYCLPVKLGDVKTGVLVEVGLDSIHSFGIPAFLPPLLLSTSRVL